MVEGLSDEDVCELAHQKLLSQLPVEERPIEDPPPPIKCIVTRWRSDRYSRGSYTFMRTRSSLKFNHPNDDQELEDQQDSNPLDLVEMSKPLWDGKLGFAGEHCSMDHYACVHGPYMTAIEEANRIRSNHHNFNPKPASRGQDIDGPSEMEKTTEGLKNHNLESTLRRSGQKPIRIQRRKI